jgi:hypothetical protein
MGLNWTPQEQKFNKYHFNYFITSRYFIYNESAFKIQRWWRLVKSQNLR